MHFMKGASILGFQNFFQDKQAMSDLHEKFAAHIEVEGLSYGTEQEYMFRFEIFKQKDAEIQKQNNEQDSYRLGHGMFSTMTDDEAKRYMGFTPVEDGIEPTIFDESNLQAGVDWRG